MMAAAYYNDFDKGAAAWLRELIRRDLIAPGDVDERSIEDVRPDELRGYTQHHFFAGIGGWSYALRLAGWPDDRPVWTGSCPCQPFSSAGKGAGFDDQRHLWPAFFHLIRECRPASVFGEQVASKAADAWIDLVHADLEGVGYAFGSVPFPSAGVGAPHIRDRNYWVGVGQADAHQQGLEGRRGVPERAAECAAGPRGVAVWMGDTNGAGSQPRRSGPEAAGHGRTAVADGGTVGMADADFSARRQGSAIDGGRHSGSDALAWSGPGGDGLPDARRPGPLHGFWRDADWLLCRDGKWRPVEPGTFPLAHGLPARVVRLRGYGNAINPHQAAEFIRASGLIEQRLEAVA
jgi:DNA (cytosine-5)-methyltransferase 1